MSQPAHMDEPRGRGQPPHKPTAETKVRVETLAGAGWRHADIAETIGISRPTLEKHYERELSLGAQEKRAAIVEALYAAGLKGNVSAAKAYLAVEPQLAAPPVENEGTSEGLPTPEPMGKKAQANADAKSAAAGSEWEELLVGSKVVPIR